MGHPPCLDRVTAAFSAPDGLPGIGKVTGMTRPSQDTAADKTLSVLEALAAHSRLADIADAAGLPKPTTHRILRTLVERGFARSDGHGDYSGGARVFALAGRFAERLDLPRQVRPMLRGLQEQTGWTVHLAVLSGDEAVYAAKIEGAKPYHLASRVGLGLGLHCTSIGKALLATMPDDEVRAVLDRTGMPARTDNTITDVGTLLPTLDEIRSRGYAEDHEENEIGVLAVGAPVFDHLGQAIAAISAAALTYQPTTDSPGERGRIVADTARELSADLGAPAHRRDLRGVTEGRRSA